MAFLPMVKLHWNLAGGTRMALLPPFVLLGIVALAASASFRLAEPRDHPSVATFWITILTIAQSVFLGLVAPSSVRKSILRDFTSGMIESHRLTPMSNLRIIAGYIIGAAIPALMLYVASVIAMLYFLMNFTAAPALRGATTPWAAAQVGLIILSFTSATIVLLTALVTAGKTNLIGVLALIGFFGGWALVRVVPGVSLVLGVTTVSMLGSMLARAPVNSQAAAIFMAFSICMQISIALICVAGACRKLRAPTRPSFGLLLAGLLQVLVGLAAIVGIVSAPYSSWLFAGFSTDASLEVIFSTVVFILLGYDVLIAAAHRRVEIDVRSAYEGPAAAGPAIDAAPLILTIATSVVMYAMMLVAPLSGWILQLNTEGWRWLIILATAFLSFWTDYNWLYIVVSRGGKMFGAIIMSVIFLKIVPIVVDLALISVREVELDRGPSVLNVSCASPAGLIAMAPVATPMLIVIGLAIQIAIAAAITWAATRFARRARRPESRDALIVANPVAG